MDIEFIIERIKRLEYHQSLLLKMISGSRDDFNRLIIEKSLNEETVRGFIQHCDELSIKLEKQKAEGFVYFHPLFNDFIMILPPKTQTEEVITACINQGVHLPLMLELRKYL